MLEGSFLAYIAGFAASLGILNIYIVLIMAPVANVIADSFYFFIGKFGRNTAVYRYFTNKIGADRVNRIENYLKTNFARTITVMKLTPAIAGPGLVLSGAANIPYKRFLPYSLALSTVYSSIVITLGFYSGEAFNTISGYFKYAEIAIGVAVVLILMVPVAIKIVSQKISQRIEKI
jgi:membrane protein DedA with SNARE-associated domain